jgi:hypothetical protein
MIQDISNYAHGGVSAANLRTSKSLRSGTNLFDSANARPNPESLEAEISRLTWLVVDGHASPEERNQLAELVGLQHSLRAG